MQFVEDFETDLHGIAPEDVVDLFSSVNTPLIAMPGRSSEEIRAYVLAHRGLGKTLEMHVYLHVISNNLHYVYGCTANPFPATEYENMKAAALDFVETMGFIMDSNGFGGLNEEAKQQLFAEAPFTTVSADEDEEDNVPLDLLKEKPEKSPGDTDFQVDISPNVVSGIPPAGDDSPLDIGFDDGTGHATDEMVDIGLDTDAQGGSVRVEAEEKLPDDLFDTDDPKPVMEASRHADDVEIDMEGPAGDSEPPVESVAWDEPEAPPPDAIPQVALPALEEEPGMDTAVREPEAEPASPPPFEVEIEIAATVDSGSAPPLEAAPEPVLPILDDQPVEAALPQEIEIEIKEQPEEEGLDVAGGMSLEAEEGSALVEEPLFEEPEAAEETSTELDGEPEEEAGISGIRMDTGEEDQDRDSEAEEAYELGPDKHEGRFLTPKSRWARRQPLFFALDEASPPDERASPLMDAPDLQFKDERQRAFGELLASL